MPYTDWHPALHTLMMAALLKLVDHPAFVLAVQGLCYALAVGYTADVLARWRIPKWVILVITAYLSLIRPSAHHAFPVEGLRVRDCRSVSGRAAAGCAFFTGGKPFPRALSRAWRDAQPVRHSAAQRHGDGFGRGRVAADRSAPKVESAFCPPCLSPC